MVPCRVMRNSTRDAYHHSHPCLRKTDSGTKAQKEMVSGETCRRIRASFHVHQRDRMRETERRDGKYTEARPCAQGGRGQAVQRRSLIYKARQAPYLTLSRGNINFGTVTFACRRSHNEEDAAR